MWMCGVVCANLCEGTKTQLVLEYSVEFDAESAHVIPIFPIVAEEGERGKYT